jgi:hypothetical protein
MSRAWTLGWRLKSTKEVSDYFLSYTLRFPSAFHMHYTSIPPVTGFRPVFMSGETVRLSA